ncbi:DoxX family protein [Legionella jamestowniensis]|uniref:DoxX n=1 Tax=Legionella jamestowniensis TaxID=455 RepID=A0A0W0UH56_9GAMM|nr:DoxX family membrane protein [Legionella jamestowniensis]KTD07252.1 hypothetical protein Ljam_1447 [Legionella jamestowniensis]OCH97999.1 hypothetical protein A8135_01895 [Legionella jamestowniensis]SFL95628.1 DoxX protein [Legionella jamestowniensis DSM 19215]
MLTAIAWLVLRVVFAGFFIYAFYSFVRNWPAAKQTATLIYPKYPNFQAVSMLVLMLLISISILLGIFGRIGGALALLFSLLGVYAHYTCVHHIESIQLPATASSDDQKLLADAKAIGIVGHITSAQKNYVIAAVSFFFMLLGTGPWSITNS